MSGLRIGDRVVLRSSGELATVVEHIKPGPFVGVRWDKPHPTTFANGAPTTTTHTCCHESSLDLAGQETLL